MRHEQVIDNLSAYIEESLDPAMRAAVDNHIRECADCYRELATLRSVFSLLDSPLAQVEPPPNFHDNVMRSIRVQVHAKHRQPARGWLGRLGWGWTAGAAAAVLAVSAILVVGPLQEGTPASVFFTPRWSQPRVVAPSSSNAPDLEIGGDGTPAAAGREYHLNLDFVARRGGNWRMTVQTSPGLTLVNTETPEEGGGIHTVWQGPLDAGARAGLALMLQPTAPGTVQEVVVGFHNDEGYSVERMVFVPVQTGGLPSATADWRFPAHSTLRNALDDLARTYGTPIVAPVDILNRQAAFEARGANAGAAVEALADAQGLRFNLYNDSYNLF